ncbi:uncharacterized protein N7506_000639 [Penicillium brevicompactum]|uniref:uncharacterized protein n=1 Tax=Penicillium brevicompactum TaxID=5074 RepID=UPI0025418A20|nr:uncharacterized protein N7506_000639 [Penicillium brevicompactum]KAJ5347386.1 hypothetical protein N7506_000639 [Penicillium brevicompactum]
MIQRLDTLPFDVFYHIATSLDDRDLIHLSRVNRALHSITQSEQIARKTVENGLLHSKEGQAAMTAQSGYRKAVGLRFAVHEAVATANPYSVACVGYAASFIYNQGHLAYRCQNHIRVLHVHGVATSERVLDLTQVLPHPLHTAGPVPADNVTLLSYSDDTLVFQVTGVSATEDALFVIDMRRSSRPRPVFHRSIPASAPIFVRHTRSYLWYGTFTAADGSDGVWTITGVDLETGVRIGIQLDRIVDGDLGQTLCFEMHDEHLYAVSTQVASDDSEIHSSFYHWFCFAPRESGRKWNGRFWRREHQEGPINEMWTDLSIRKDEMTGQPVILECRREWRDGKTTAGAGRSSGASFGGAMTTPSWVSMDGDLAPCKRLRRHYHAEYESGSTKRQEFIPARTKHRSYHLGSSTFVDLVNDPASDGLRSRDRLRLRTVSRKRKSPIDKDGTEGYPNRLFQPTQTDAVGRPIEGSEERFECRGVHMWPPENATAVQQLLCPSTRIGSVKSTADERSIIYSIDAPGLPSNHQALILISFDPNIRLPTLNPLPTPEDAIDTWAGDKFLDVPLPSVYPSSNMVEESLPYYMKIKHGYMLR